LRQGSRGSLFSDRRRGFPRGDVEEEEEEEEEEDYWSLCVYELLLDEG